MGDVCCKGNVQAQSLGEVPSSLIVPSHQENQEQSLNQTTPQPQDIFAKPFTDNIQFLPIIDQRTKQLGPFEFESGAKSPQGKMLGSYRLNNGTIYTGEWKNGQIHGKGLYLLPNQTVMYCLTNQNKISGQGRVIYPNGDYFEGEIVDGQANGKGKYVEGGITYVGDFKDNLFHGDGIEKAPNYEFQGIFENGIKTFGKLRWMVNGQVNEYVGQFVQNLMEGKGTLISGGGKYVGSFKKGLKQGQGKFFYKSNNQYYEGSFYNDNRHGQGVIIDEIEGKVLAKGNWFNDVFQA